MRKISINSLHNVIPITSQENLLVLVLNIVHSWLISYSFTHVDLLAVVLFGLILIGLRLHWFIVIVGIVLIVVLVVLCFVVGFVLIVRLLVVRLFMLVADVSAGVWVRLLVVGMHWWYLFSFSFSFSHLQRFRF